MLFRKDRYMQYAAAFSVSILSLTIGMCMSWSSPILPQLLSEHSPIGVTLSLEEGSWVTSILLLGYLTGNLLLGKLMDVFGRKGVLLMSIVPIFGSWMMILFARSAVVLYIARFISGFGEVFPTIAGVIYIGEISEPSIRGELGMLNLLMAEVGSLLVTIIGSYTTYEITAISVSLVPIIFGLTFMWFPESPYYYLRKNDVESARQSLKRLRGNTDIEKEIMDMQICVEKEMTNKSTIGEIIRTAKYRKPVLIIIGMKTLQQMSGVAAINNYMQIIFNQASTGLNSYQSSIICTAVPIPAILCASYLIDRFGRKPLYYISSAGCGLALFSETIYFFLQDYLNNDMTALGWLPIFGIILTNLSRVVGIHTMPYILSSEIFPTNIKGKGLTISFSYSSTLAFFISLYFPMLVESLGYYVIFFIFSVFCFSGTPFAYFFINETKGKTFNRIQKEMEQKSDE